MKLKIMKKEDPIDALSKLGKAKLMGKSIKRLKKEARAEIEEHTTKFEHCDYQGICKNKTYKEVYPMMLGKRHKNRGWSYLCRKHFIQEQKHYKNKLPYASID